MSESSLGRDLVSAANCGTSNPLVQLSSQLNSMNQYRMNNADIMSMNNEKFSNPQNIVLHQSNTHQPLMLMPSTQNHLQSVNSVVQPINQREFLLFKQQNQHLSQQQDDLMQQFMSMQLNKQNQQQNDHALMEQMYNQQVPSTSNSDNTAIIPHSARPQTSQLNHQHTQMRHNPAQFNHMSMMPMIQQQQQLMMQSQMKMQHLQQQQMQYHQMRMQHQQSQFRPQMTANDRVQLQNESDVKQSAEQLYNDTAKQQEFVNSFVDSSHETAAASASSNASMGGLDAATLDRLMNSSNPKWRNSKFLQFINKINRGEVSFENNQVVERNPNATSSQRQHQYQHQQQQDDTSQQGVDIMNEQWQNEFSSESKSMQDWADEYKQEHSNENRPWQPMNSEIAQKWAAEFEEQQRQFAENNELYNDSIENITSDSFSSDPEYRFLDSSSNPYMQQYQQLQQNQSSHQPPDQFAEAQRLFAAGELHSAIQCLESCVQFNPDHADAWCLLGRAQAENECEHEAIAALLRTIQIDPYNLHALLMLAVSYTNDLEESRALQYLRTWLLHHPDYQSLPIIQEQKQQLSEYNQLYGDATADDNISASIQADGGLPIMDGRLHDDVVKLFKSALSQHSQDAELHTVLGVLYHLSNDFDLSVQEFKTALQLSPNDAQLWNKLGATFANSNRSQDAIQSYKRALQLRPKYVRAEANLAISYANMGDHENAIIHYLKTLERNNKAEHIWSYLRVSLGHLGRTEQIELTKSKNVQAFKQLYDFDQSNAS